MNKNAYNGIVLFGEMGSGKDVVAEMLSELIPNCALYNIGFICRELMKVSKVNNNWTDKKRELGQLAADKLREIDINILNDYTYALTLEDKCFNIIIGGRTMDDFDYWKNKGFLTVGVTVDSDVRLQRLKKRDGVVDIDSFKHSTENSAGFIANNLCEVVLNNSFTLDILKENLTSILFKYKSNLNL